MPTVVVVAALVVAFIPGWVRAMRFPQPQIAKTIMAGIGALAIFAAWHGAVYVVYVAALAIFAAFMGEMVRKDGRENLLGQVSGTYLGSLVVCSAALWVSVMRFDGLGIIWMIAVMMLFGSLGRYAAKTGRTLSRGASARWALPVWLTACALVGGICLIMTIEPTSNPAPYVWAACIALSFGVSASLADLAAKDVSSRSVAVSLAVLPHCVLGAIGYASLLIVQ
ncbi:MAG: hypothetical protein Q3979_02725 [Actinomycetaceae bacterium]|nr:hypothetical protein [Actinomycetaceae bacterium]